MSADNVVNLPDATAGRRRTRRRRPVNEQVRALEEQLVSARAALYCAVAVGDLDGGIQADPQVQTVLQEVLERLDHVQCGLDELALCMPKAAG
jgi:hypothetical protein